MVEEAALGDPGRLDQLLDRGGGETLVDDRIVGDVEQAGAGALALGAPPSRVLRTGLPVQLYRRCSFLDELLDHELQASPAGEAKLPEARAFLHRGENRPQSC